MFLLTLNIGNSENNKKGQYSACGLSLRYRLAMHTVNFRTWH